MQAKHHGHYPIETRSGPNPVFTAEEEKQLVDYLLLMSRRGFPLTKNQLLNVVQDLVTKLDKKTPFVNNRPSKHWYKAFLARNPELTEQLI